MIKYLVNISRRSSLIHGLFYVLENIESPIALFFGCRKPSDQLYEKELAEAVDVGALSHTFTAYSRSPNVPKVKFYSTALPIL